MPVRPMMSLVEVKLVAVAASKLRTLLVALGTCPSAQFPVLFQLEPAAPVQVREAGAVRSSSNCTSIGENAGRLRGVAEDDLLTRSTRPLSQELRAIGE